VKTIYEKFLFIYVFDLQFIGVKTFSFCHFDMKTSSSFLPFAFCLLPFAFFLFLLPFAFFL